MVVEQTVILIRRRRRREFRAKNYRNDTNKATAKHNDATQTSTNNA
jgi:hypothetical protein